MQNFRTLGQPVMGEKKPGQRERREKKKSEKKTVIVDTTFRLQCLRAQFMRTN